ncbi:MAG: hypothetical protein ACJAVK_001645, partial [Akkermansiaceae bacterium]
SRRFQNPPRSHRRQGNILNPIRNSKDLPRPHSRILREWPEQFLHSPYKNILKVKR